MTVRLAPVTKMKFSLFYTYVGVFGILIVIVPFQYKHWNNKLTGMLIINEGIVQDKVVGLTVTTQNTTGVLARRFPDAIIIGGKKCGTTVLRDMLSHHRLIKIAKKEMFYFSNSDRYKLGISWYINQMPLTKEGELTLEKSPQYFTSKVTPERLERVSPDVKLMLILRNPLSRSISDYFFMQRKGRQTTTFNKKFFPKGKKGEINTRCSETHVSMYDIHYSEWLKWFPKEQILIVNGDNLKINPIEELTKIEKFLNIPHYFENDMFQCTGRRYYWKDPDSKKHYVGIQHKLPDVPQDTLYEVAMFLQPHASKFCQMASVNYTWCTDILADRMTWNSTTKMSGTPAGNNTTKTSDRLTLTMH